MMYRDCSTTNKDIRGPEESAIRPRERGRLNVDCLTSGEVQGFYIQDEGLEVVITNTMTNCLCRIGSVL